MFLATATFRWEGHVLPLREGVCLSALEGWREEAFPGEQEAQKACPL